MVQKVLKFRCKEFQHVVYARESGVNLRVPQEGVRGGSEGGPGGGSRRGVYRGSKSAVLRLKTGVKVCFLASGSISPNLSIFGGVPPPRGANAKSAKIPEIFRNFRNFRKI